MIAMRTNKTQRGSTMLEFTLAGIPVLFLIICTVQLSLAMWNYHTLAYAVNQGVRYTALHGQGCWSNGNSCGATVGTIANQIAAAAIGVPSGQVNFTLTTASGQTTTCNPLSSCFSSSTAWPPATNSDNVPGKNVTVSAKYVFPFMLAMLWPGAGAMRTGTIALSASATQQILY
jgi:Flp pilus assembly protein TadG